MSLAQKKKKNLRPWVKIQPPGGPQVLNPSSFGNGEHENMIHRNAMSQNPNRTRQPHPTTKTGSKMGGEFAYQPKWDPKTVLTTTAIWLRSMRNLRPWHLCLVCKHTAGSLAAPPAVPLGQSWPFVCTLPATNRRHLEGNWKINFLS